MSEAYKTPRLTVFLLIVCSVVGLAGTDLVLPAVPSLPEALAGTAAQSQLVLASFVAGGALGLLMFGELGARYDQRRLLLFSLAAYAVTSGIAAYAATLPVLIGIRFFQGVSSAAAAVFAPGIIRVVFSEQKALRAIGVLSSVESLAPALAPIIGAWLLFAYGWQASFVTIAVIAAVLFIAVFLIRKRIPNVHPERAEEGYMALLKNRSYLRQALSQALTLGGLLIFVFGAPAVITKTMGGQLSHFIVMQVSGITTFIIAANSAQHLTARFGSDSLIKFGSVLSTVGGLLIFFYATLGFQDPRWLALLFVPMNFGLGLRGPPGFYAAIVASKGNDARGSALLILMVLLIAALGTAVCAPLILQGLVPLATVSVIVSALSIVVLYLLSAAPEQDT
ncbi:MAG: MFS transporter [Woeseiaceae bacterium]